MSSQDDLLIEIGTEELPPKALRSLMQSFGENLAAALDEAHLARGDVTSFASPRRLAVLVRDLTTRQEDRRVTQKGPPTKIAFDDDGNATTAAEAFARKCGVAVSDLGREQTGKGEWLTFNSTERGQTTAELIGPLIEKVLATLPIPRRMRWGAGDAEFVRPVHWVLLLHGEQTITSTVMGIESGDTSRGHRFHCGAAIKISSPQNYLKTLYEQGYVVADFERRRELVQTGADAAAATEGGTIVDGEALYDEVAALVEWPVPVLGEFDERYLRLPREVVISTLTGHQRYFPVADRNGELLARFVTIANIESADPKQVKDGNERVIRPRLADAAFFWDSDRKKTLKARCDTLHEVVYQRGLGSLFDKSERIATLAESLAETMQLDSEQLRRAATLAKCDLLTGMVGEFPELQGTMGRYYAQADGETDVVADAIGEHYLPRFAGDILPGSPHGQALGIADKLDTLAGIFSIGKKPSGNRDPFGLRRAALGIVRILIECGIDTDLRKLIETAVSLQPKGKLAEDEISTELHAFISDRLRRYFLDRDDGLTTETFDAVMARAPVSLLDFDRRLAAVQTFARLEQAASLAAANKRIANILRKAADPGKLSINERLLEDGAEKTLFSALDAVQQKVTPLLETRSYAEVLNVLADLRDPVDRYFDDVMVMAEDDAIRNNRLALLTELRALFLHVADISRLSISQA